MKKIEVVLTLFEVSGLWIKELLDGNILYNLYF